MKIRNITGGGQTFYCPGCESTHALNTSKNGPRWTYNGDPARPTFSPSVLATCDWREGREVCHSFVRDGVIEFLNDCTHKLAGQKVPMPDWPYAPGTYGGVEDVP